MGACLSDRRFEEVKKKDVVVIFKPEFQTEDGSSCSVDVAGDRRESFNSDIIDIIDDKIPLVKLKDSNSDEFNAWMSNSNFNMKLDISEERSTESTTNSNKIYLSSINETPITTSPIKTLPASTYRRKDFNTENSYQSNDGVHRMATGDISQTCSLSIKDDQETEDDSVYFGLECKSSFDGLNMRFTNRYDIGIAVLKAQIHHGADPNRINTHGGRTALMFSVMAKDLDFTKELVELGVDLNQSNHLGETALSLAREGQNVDIVNYLRSQGALDTVAE